MSKETDARALELFLAAVPLDAIGKRLNISTPRQVQSAISRALKLREKNRDLELMASVELERLDRLYTKAFNLAMKSDDVNAMDKCLKISEQRMRIAPVTVGVAGNLEAAYDATIEAVASLDRDGLDRAVIESGRAVARQIDAAIKHGTGAEITKALYLMPHLMNVLRELGATPAAREALSKTYKQATSFELAPVSSLASQRSKYANK